jgi:hypothetical protein
MAGYPRRLRSPADLPVTASSRTTRRDPAPGGLELVRAFINSSDIEQGTDELATTAGVEAWLRSRGLPIDESGVTEHERRRLESFREALRDLIACRERGEPLPEAIELLDEAARSSPLTVAFDSNGSPMLRPTRTGVMGLVGLIMMRSRPRRSPERGPASRSAGATPADGRSTTRHGTAPGSGARWQSAGIGRRFGPCGSAVGM